MTFNCTKPFFGFVARDLFVCGQVLRCDCDNGDRIEIPILHRTDEDGVARRLGFLTDFASKPWLAELFVGDRCDEGTVAYVFHDWLYCSKKVLRFVDGRWVKIEIDRGYADVFLAHACLALRMDSAKANRIYAGVCLGGASHFEREAINLSDITVDNPSEDFAVLTARVVPDFDIEEAA